jgi:mannitol/fructose-specific phosphotransferase system IIA component (Ntr-type)
MIQGSVVIPLFYSHHPRDALDSNRQQAITMKHILNSLIQLQELNFALAEQETSDPDSNLKQLEASVQELSEKIPTDVFRRYEQLQRRFPIAVVPIIRNNCSGCGLAVPPQLVNDVRAGKLLHSCPHCGRFLYWQEGLPKSPAKTVPRKLPRAGIGRFSAEELMIPRLAATTRDEVITELAQALVTQGFVEEPKSLVDLALRREAMVSTAVEHGLAFPHVRNVEGGGLTFALGLKPSGIKFGAPDDRLTKIFFFIVIPPAASAFYLKLLAGIVQAYHEADARNELLKCETPEEMWKAIQSLTRATVP